MNSLKKNNRNILIIDDEPDVLSLFKNYLESENWNVTATESPLKAFEFLRKKAFFFILVDIAMPEMDGYDFINKIEEMNIPSQIGLMTGFGYNPKHTLVKINKKGKFPIFFKPFKFNNPGLKKAVREAWETYHKEI